MERSLRRLLALLLAAATIVAPTLAPAVAASEEYVPVWTKLSPPSAPSVRSGSALTPMISLGRLLLFGGCNGGKLGDTWEFDTANGTWTNRTAAPMPPIRYSPALVSDPVARQTVLFGGAGPAVLNDTWRYQDSNGTWSNASPPASPPPRQAHVMAFAPKAQRMVMFGGVGGAYGFADLNDTWVYDRQNNTWTEAAPSPSPSARYWPAFTFVGPGDRFMLYGGGTPNGTLSDVWFYQLENNSWWRSSAAAPPGPRRETTLAHHPSLDRVIMFGGSAPGLRNDTWSYQLSSGTWSNITPAISPEARTEHAMSLDPASGKFVMFSGFRTGGASFYLNDTWLLDLLAPAPGNSAGLLLPIALLTVATMMLLVFRVRRRRTSVSVDQDGR